MTNSRAAGGIAVDPEEVRISTATLEAASAELLARTGLTDSESELDGDD